MGGELELLENGNHRLLLQLVLGMRDVPEVNDQIRMRNILQSDFEGVDQLDWEISNEADGVHQDGFGPRWQLDAVDIRVLTAWK